MRAVSCKIRGCEVSLLQNKVMWWTMSVISECGKISIWNMNHFSAIFCSNYLFFFRSVIFPLCSGCDDILLGITQFLTFFFIEWPQCDLWLLIGNQTKYQMRISDSVPPSHWPHNTGRASDWLISEITLNIHFPLSWSPGITIQTRSHSITNYGPVISSIWISTVKLYIYSHYKKF